MKKIYIISIISLIFTLIIILALYFTSVYKTNNNNIELAKNNNENILKNNEIETQKYTDSVETVEIDKKISPDCTLIIKKYYKKCGHTTKDYATIPEELVNKSEEDVKNIYKDWKVIGFSQNEIVLYKEVDGICNEHYLLKEIDNVIGVYILDENDNETLQERTGISTKYLPQEDIEKIKEGIKVIGKEELNSTLEDYE